MDTIETIELGSFNDGAEKVINTDSGISSFTFCKFWSRCRNVNE